MSESNLDYIITTKPKATPPCACFVWWNVSYHLNILLQYLNWNFRHYMFIKKLFVFPPSWTCDTNECKIVYKHYNEGDREAYKRFSKRRHQGNEKMCDIYDIGYITSTEIRLSWFLSLECWSYTRGAMSLAHYDYKVTYIVYHDEF